MAKNLTLEIKDFGPINHAKIELGDLDFKKEKKSTINIIAGKNATGKSMLSRLVYTSIATIGNEGKEIYKQKLDDSFDRLVDRLIMYVHDLTRINPRNKYRKRNFPNDESSETISPNPPSKRKHDPFETEAFVNNFDIIVKKFNSYSLREGDEKNILNTLSELEKLFDEHNFHPQILEEKIKNFKKGIEILNRNHEMRSDVFQIILNSEFGKDRSKLINRDEDSISFYLSKKEPLVRMGINATLFCFHQEINAGDVFYIETPYVLDFTKDRLNHGVRSNYRLNHRVRPNDRFGSIMFPLHHQRSLMAKLKSEGNNEWLFGSNNNNEINDPKELLNNALKGNIQYEEGEFIYEPDYGVPFNSTNVAAGIKIIGILQLLLEKGLDDNSFIIMDEPEIHLHPDWQVKLAETIIILAKRYKINFHINTHSPQFVEAIDTYAMYYEILDNVNYYNASSNGDKCDIKKVDHSNISDIYDELGRAYDKLDEVRAKIRVRNATK